MCSGVLLFFLFFSAFSFSPVLAGSEPFQFDLSPVISVSPGTLTATLTAIVAPEYMLYREQFGFALSRGNLQVDYPPAHQKDDPTSGGKVEIFDAGAHAFHIFLSSSALSSGPATMTIDYQGCSSQTCFMPAQKNFLIDFRKDAFEASSTPPPGTPSTTTPEQIRHPWLFGGITAVSVSETLPKPGIGPVSTPSGRTDFDRDIREHGILWALFLAFLGGLLVSFTPCVYPMIPITLSIIGGRTENRSPLQGFLLSVTYVAGLSLTYALLGLLVAMFGAHIRGILQGTFFQALVAAVFLILALSMFDVFMLQAPSFLRQRLAGLKAAGLGGIFLMGMVSGLMASPCVAAPLAGILAFIAASGSLFLGFFLLLAFAWGMGVILVGIGTFSGSLNSLPKAGEWMERVKEFYGFLLLGAALYFAKPMLGTAVLNLLTAMLLASFAAFLGLFSLPAAEDTLFTRVRKAWGIVALSVSIAFALTAAVEWGGLSLPPMSGTRILPVAAPAPLWYDGLESALAEAKRSQKSVFVDFRADWCSICRELDEKTFPDPLVQAQFGRMVLARIDATQNTPEIAALLKKFGVMGLPTLIILNSSGEELTEFRIVGDVNAQTLSRTLREALIKGR